MSSFSRTLAIQNARVLTREELDLAIHVVCSAFNARYFQGIRTLNDVRDMVDILSHEQHRRDDHDAIAPLVSRPRNLGAGDAL